MGYEHKKQNLKSDLKNDLKVQTLDSSRESKSDCSPWSSDQVPYGWSIRRIKKLGILKSGAGFPEIEQGLQDLEIPFLKVGDTGSNPKRSISHWNHSISQKTALKLRAHIFPKGTIVFAKVGAALLLNRRKLLERPSCIDNNLMGFIPAHCNIDWAFYCLSVLDLGTLVNPGAVPSVNEEQIGSVQVYVPPVTTQIKIASFLDRETAKIDALIAKKQQLMELLAEKRRAIIFEKISRGLNPHVLTKESGYDWLGRIPSHWSVSRIKFVARLRSGHTPSRQHPEYWENCSIPWFGLADIWQLRDDRKIYIAETSEKISELGLANSAARLLPKGTVILSRTASVGFSGIMAIEMATTQDFVNWICGASIMPEYLLYVFRSMRSEFDRLNMGSTHQTIYMPDVGRFCTPVPPIKEQLRIVEHIMKRTEEVDRLLDKVDDAIEKLNEYRRALISAAVTGNIDISLDTSGSYVPTISEYL